MDAAAEVDAAQLPPSRAELAVFRRAATPHEGAPTPTWHAQREVEQTVFLLSRGAPAAGPPLRRAAHAAYLRDGLGAVPAGYAGLHASQPWLLYWMVHGLDLLGAPVDAATGAHVVAHLRACWDERGGGFGGGPGQDGHLASTYAAVAALAVVGSEDAFAAMRPAGLRAFLGGLKCDDGGFRVSRTGEKDVRALYSALAAASLAGVLDAGLSDGVGAYVRSLVSFDGGLGGEPGAEGHGGNTYCGVAAAALAGVLAEVDTAAVVDWAAMRQCRMEGGFCGRTNKLVDSCYSFWVGALFPILGAPAAFNAQALQRYILTCCQEDAEDGGGLRDKPGVAADFHHTCYALSGLSVAQHYGGAEAPDAGSKVRKVDVLHNVCEERLAAARAFWERAGAASEEAASEKR